MKNTGRKKNKVLVIVAIIAMIAIVASLGAATFAKYITSVNVPAKTATVAKWGFVINANADALVGTEYGDTVTDATVSPNAGGKVVVGASAVVAPGTTGSMTFSIKGSAEVLSKVIIDANGTSDVSISDGTNSYNPIKWTLKNGSTDIATDVSLEEVVSALEGMYPTNIAAGTVVDDTYTLSWKWNFDNTAATTVLADDGAAVLTGNVADTILGYTADGSADAIAAADAEIAKLAGTGSTAKTIADYTIETEMSFDITISIEQVQS